MQNNIETELNRVFSNYVITFIEKEKNGYLIAVVPRNDFYKKNYDYQQQHYDGKTLAKALASIP